MTYEKFHKCQCGRDVVNNRFDILTSYVTDIAIVDKKLHKIYMGRYAQGFSVTTTKQFRRMAQEWYKGFQHISYNSYEYIKFVNQWKIPDYWDRLHHCHEFGVWGNLKKAL